MLLELTVGFLIKIKIAICISMLTAAYVIGECQSVPISILVMRSRLVPYTHNHLMQVTDALK